jgi:hypothetical protein
LSENGLEKSTVITEDETLMSGTAGVFGHSS